MKKLFSLFAAMLFTMGAWAEVGFWTDNGSHSISFWKGIGTDATWTFGSTASTQDLGGLQSFYLKRFNVKLWENTDDINNQTEMKMYYRVYPANGVAGSFNPVTFNGTPSYSGWNNGTQNITYTQYCDVNLLSGLTEGGSYVFEFYFQFGSSLYLSNNSQNYKMNFTYCAAPISEYVNRQPVAHAPALTWETYVNGNVVITMSDAEGATNATFRNGGFEGGIGAWVVLSGDEFATSEPAESYFTRNETNSTTFTLKKKADVVLPNPCKIKFQNAAYSWSCDEKTTAWESNCEMVYTYGTLASVFDAPTNVNVSEEGVITFSAFDYAADAVADTYEARIYKNGDLVKTQDVVSGDVLNYVPTETGIYQVKVIVTSGNYASAESVAFDWNLTAGQIFGTSEYCEYLWNTTDYESWPIKMSWETQPNGDIKITILPNGDEGDGVTAFRGTGMEINKLKVNGADASTLFTINWSENELTLVVDQNNKPAVGSVISYNGMLLYKTGTHTNAWPTLTVNCYTYGTACEHEPEVFDTEVNLALNKNSWAGGAEGGNVAAKANDGSNTSYWGTYGCKNESNTWEEVNVWTVDMEAPYVINSIKVSTSGTQGAGQIAVIEYSVDNTNWNEAVASQDYDDNTVYEHTGLSFVAQYIRFRATKSNMCAIKEFEVYGAGHAYPLTITSAGWASLCLPYAVEIPAEMTAYYASSANNTTITLSEVADGVIPAKEGVLVKAAQGQYYLPEHAAVSAIVGNLFKGTPDRAIVVGASSTYVLSSATQPDDVVFGLYTGTNMPANKAYLPVSALGASGDAPSRISFVIEDTNVATGIEAVETEVEAVKFIENGQIFIKKNGVVYNVMGQVIR